MTDHLPFSLAAARTAAGRTQVAVAAAMGTTQSGVSRLERQADILVSTLAAYVEAIGGTLRLVAADEHDEVVLTLWPRDSGAPALVVGATADLVEIEAMQAELARLRAQMVAFAEWFEASGYSPPSMDVPGPEIG